MPDTGTGKTDGRRLQTSMSFACSILALCLGDFAQCDEFPVRLDIAVPQLRAIDSERWTYLAENPDRLSVHELNRGLDEIDVIEIDNSIAAYSEGNTIRVVAWNLERGRHWREAVELVRSNPALSNPDVLLLSEMDLGMARSGNVHTTRELAIALGLNYAYAVEFIELSGGDADERATATGPSEFGYHGNAILSRFPLERVRALRFPGIERWYGTDQHRLGGRNAIFAEIVVAGTPITLISTHYESDLGDHASREEATRMIIAELERSSATDRIIFGGDLNTIHTRPAITLLEEAGLDFSNTNLLDEPTVQRTIRDSVKRVGPHIDYIAGRGLTVERNETSPAVVLGAWPPRPDGRSIGDHAPVSVLFKAP